LQGFTLLEMLIVIGITAALVTAAVQAHLGIRRAQERAARGLQRERAAEVFLDRLERELVGTLLIVRPSSTDRLSHPYVFVGEDYFESDGDTDALRFVTRSPARAAPQVGAVGMRLVTYVAQSGNESLIELVREEEPLPDGLDKEPIVEEGQAVLDGVALFRLRYLDEDSDGWRDSWDSTDVAMLDRLPGAVEVTLALLEEDELGERQAGPEHPRVVRLPVRPIDFEVLAGVEGAGVEDPNALEEDEEEDDEGCTRIEECLTVMPVNPDALSQVMRQLQRCYKPTDQGLAEAVDAGRGRWDYSTCPFF
jgi:type II secretion system protein J